MSEAPSKTAVPAIMFMPGGIFARLELPPGLPDCDILRSRQVSLLRESPALAPLTAEEREGILSSLASTIRRATYHNSRFNEILRELEVRRAQIPGEVFYDAIVECLHFEFQASCGAARMALDELVYIIARRHGVSETRARAKARGDKLWETNNLFTCTTLAEECDVPEIAEMRSRRDWYDTLNAYRNAFFHHGWRHGAGYFAKDDDTKASKAPSRNALILPDRTSLKGRNKPYEWTWNEGQMLDDVARSVHEDLGELINTLCSKHWGTPEPAQGSIPPEHKPTILATFAKPFMLRSEKALIAPLFSTRELAERFDSFRKVEGLEIRKLRSAQTFLSNTPEFVLSFADLEKISLPPEVSALYILLDPEPADETWAAAKWKYAAMVPLKDLLSKGTHHPLRLAFPDTDEAFMWCQHGEHKWPIFSRESAPEV